MRRRARSTSSTRDTDRASSTRRRRAPDRQGRHPRRGSWGTGPSGHEGPESAQRTPERPGGRYGRLADRCADRDRCSDRQALRTGAREPPLRRRQRRPGRATGRPHDVQGPDGQRRRAGLGKRRSFVAEHADRPGQALRRQRGRRGQGSPRRRDGGRRRGRAAARRSSQPRRQPTRFERCYPISTSRPTSSSCLPTSIRLA